MPLDESLNKDVDDGVARHCALTGKLKDNDPKKFLRDTPERLTSAYLRVWTGWPPSERIVEDILKFTISLKKILVAKGCMIPDGHNKQKGDRKYKSDRPDARGGKTVKGVAQPMRWMHSDADEANADRKKRSRLVMEG